MLTDGTSWCRSVIIGATLIMLYRPGVAGQGKQLLDSRGSSHTGYFERELDLWPLQIFFGFLWTYWEIFLEFCGYFGRFVDI